MRHLSSSENAPQKSGRYTNTSAGVVAIRAVLLPPSAKLPLEVNGIAYASRIQATNVRANEFPIG